MTPSACRRFAGALGAGPVAEMVVKPYGAEFVAGAELVVVTSGEDVDSVKFQSK